MRKFAFTLAEVMIVLGIIGLVAVFTMPVLLSEVTERVNTNRQANIVQKVTKAVELMIVNGDYEQFQTTEEFADKLQKYLKTVKRCNNNNLTQCWTSNTVTTSDGSKYNVANAKTGRDLHVNVDTNTVGFVLADGGNIILTYNPNATIPNADAGFKASKKSLPIGGKKFKEFAYTSNATGAIDFVMDVNGATGPNAESDNDENYYDIRSFKVASFSSTGGCPGYKVNGVCFYNLGTDYSFLNCNDSKNSKYCSGRLTATEPVSYLAGARKACQDLGMTAPNNVNDGNTLARLLNAYDDERFPNTTLGITDSQGYWHWVYQDSNGEWKYNDNWQYPYNQYYVMCVSY